MVVVGLAAGIERRELFGLRIVHGQLSAARSRHREIFGELVRRVLAERRLLLRRPQTRGHPDTTLLVHHDAARIGRPLPDLLGAVVRRGRSDSHRRRRRGNLDRRRPVLDRIERGQHVDASGWRRKSGRWHSTSDADRRWQWRRFAPPVGPDQSHSEMTRLRSTPVGRGGACFGTAPAAMRSVHSAKRLAALAEAFEAGRHPRAGGADADAMVPGFQAGVERAEHLRNGARRRVAQLMTRQTATRRVEDLLFLPLWQLHHRKPVVRRVDLRGGFGVGCDHRFQIELLARLGVRPVASRPARSRARTPGNSPSAGRAARNVPDRR